MKINPKKNKVLWIEDTVQGKRFKNVEQKLLNYLNKRVSLFILLQLEENSDV